MTRGVLHGSLALADPLSNIQRSASFIGHSHRTPAYKGESRPGVWAVLFQKAVELMRQLETVT